MIWGMSAPHSCVTQTVSLANCTLIILYQALVKIMLKGYQNLKPESFLLFVYLPIVPGLATNIAFQP